jgi:Helix-turn-helix domain
MKQIERVKNDSVAGVRRSMLKRLKGGPAIRIDGDDFAIEYYLVSFQASPSGCNRRVGRRLTQEQVGRLVDPPIHHTLISRYENGLSVPPWTLVQLARVLHLELVPTNPVTNEAQHV